MKDRFSLLAAGFFGATGVACGAFGAHALQAHLTELNTRSIWETAAHYQLLHSAALLACAGWPSFAPTQRGKFVLGTRCWALGIAIFSGSLYILALGGPRWMGAITPIGGLGFIVGWLAIVAAGYSHDSE